jgi:hypothetical protein
LGILKLAKLVALAHTFILFYVHCTDSSKRKIATMKRLVVISSI